MSTPFQVLSGFPLYSIPHLFTLFCIGPLKHMDPAVEESARTSGSNWWQTTTRITLPLVAPALISSFILAFVLAIEDLGSPLVLGYPFGIQTISTMIFDGIGPLSAGLWIWSFFRYTAGHYHYSRYCAAKADHGIPLICHRNRSWIPSDSRSTWVKPNTSPWHLIFYMSFSRWLFLSGS